MRRAFGTVRPPFLVLTLACVALSAALAAHLRGPVGTLDVVLVLVAALSAHISVNSFNEFFDFHSGLDLKTFKTPFSGGSGTLVADPGASTDALQIALYSLLLCIAIGLYFVRVQGWTLLPVGVIGVLLVYGYTNTATKNPWLCLVAAGFGFGPLMMLGGYVALSGYWDTAALWASVVVFAVVNNLLLVNQLPDVEADAHVGRSTLPMKFSGKTIAVVYLLFAALAAFALVRLSLLLAEPALWQRLWPTMLPLSLSLVVATGIYSYSDNTRKLLPYMALNVAVAVLTPAVMAVSIAAL